MRDPRQLARILEIRRLQRTASEMGLARALRSAAAAAEARRSAELRLVDDQRAWMQRMAHPTLDLAAARAWAGLVAEDFQGLATAEAAAVLTEQARSVEQAALAGALSREEIAQAMVARTARQTERDRDRRVLNTLDERNAGSRP